MYPYVFVETADSGILYNGNGTKYCTNGSGLNCLEAYAVDEILKEWTCNGAVAAGDCSNYSGTIVFDNCDDGTSFFFIELADGRLWFIAHNCMSAITNKRLVASWDVFNLNDSCHDIVIFIF